MAALLLVVLLLAGVGYYLLTRQPDWYQLARDTPSQRIDAANNAVQKYAGIQSWAADAQAAEVRQIRGTDDASSARYAPVSDELTISFSQEELNGFFESWATQFDWEHYYGKYLKDPVVVLQDGRIVVAAQLEGLNTVASFHFQPQLDSAGQLKMDLVRVLGGRLPLPRSTWAAQASKLESALHQRMGGWRKKAKISASGIANDEAVYCGLSQLALRMFDGESADPVIFLWVTGDLTASGRSFRKMPVRITAVQVDQEALKLTLRRLNAAERNDYLAQLRMRLSR